MKKKIKGLLISQFFWPESFPINPIIKNIKEIDFTILTANQIIQKERYLKIILNMDI